ncbi:carboxypeptidase-like regulatory domain-containing protein [Flavobacterium sp. DG1-102-2]|uniref:carboxypeptidase-like regulatory domain-containing protein n=1 Tax=Flavobacterium sp. DG1-102-2 TaxID=3081663 RepID=UPI0029496DAB|nr:carboxypeptidase-like regulatory domain-containing protein [Flavobacterium sp. DG1-102-2]MDV6168360.1 carboxypeptidase-like regulatory domain-containing protein [Flavobacterium sp. DG1-102-2]
MGNKFTLSLIATFLTYFFAAAQTISGYVYDEMEHKPLEGANVYLDGTTHKTVTDGKGYFSLSVPQKINTILAVSFMGFQTYLMENPFDQKSPVTIILKEDATKLNEVVISKSTLFSRKEMLRAFRKNFLGQSPAGSSCKIENEDDIFLYYDTQTLTLIAEARKPIQIINKRLKYHVVFDLEGFQVNYRQKTLNEVDIVNSFFAGTTFFADSSENGNADKKRNEAYLGSHSHFLKSLANGKTAEEKYELYVDKFKADFAEYFAVEDTVNVKKISVIKTPPRPNIILGSKQKEPKVSKFRFVRYTILYDKKLQSFLTFDRGVFYIDKNGLFTPINEVLFGGYMGTLKAGDLLPVDYDYKG